ncbi:hypothetical protein ILUMI_26154 [Ignelater luminosus]|uniref:Uncharacterized protein n=1 Tax=Ignelater luminosus TaxID=2038154 RepID=A0A8K0FZ82_IGNLU|nr:hypothetical protein ILUMI_26154 [Ignelater luminosus]
MPFGAKAGKKRDSNSTPVQKVVIPKGVINPDETTIIEIPARLHKQPIVVAKRKVIDGEMPANHNDPHKNIENSPLQNTFQQPISRSFKPQFNSTCVQRGECSIPPTNYETLESD